MAQDTLRLTTQQRLAALERENVVLLDRIRVLHDMLKQQRQLINEYITKKIVLAGQERPLEGKAHDKEALYTFVCQQRFERMEKRLDALRVDSSGHAARRKAV